MAKLKSVSITAKELVQAGAKIFGTRMTLQNFQIISEF